MLIREHFTPTEKTAFHLDAPGLDINSADGGSIDIRTDNIRIISDPDRVEGHDFKTRIVLSDDFVAGNRTTDSGNGVVLDGLGQFKAKLDDDNLIRFTNDGGFELKAGDLFSFDTDGGVATLAGFSVDANYLWTGVKKTADGFSSSGLTIYQDGSIRTPQFYTDAGLGTAHFGGELNAVTGSLGALDVEGALTMGSSGIITNSNEDFTISEDGFNVPDLSGVAFNPSSAYTVGDYGFIFGDSQGLNIESRNGEDLTLWAIDGADVNIGANGHITLNSLPTSNPGGLNRVWNDGGTLKIT